jgi:hypothetical protein
MERIPYYQMENGDADKVELLKVIPLNVFLMIAMLNIHFYKISSTACAILLMLSRIQSCGKWLLSGQGFCAVQTMKCIIISQSLELSASMKRRSSRFLSVLRLRFFLKLSNWCCVSPRKPYCKARPRMKPLRQQQPIIFRMGNWWNWSC